MSHESPSRCARCRLHLRDCLCAEIPRLAPGFSLVLLRHFREAHKTTNTGRLACLAFENSALFDYGAPGTPPLTPVWSQPGAVLLFPDDTESAPPVPKVVTHLVVLDGSWSQARRAARRLPGLSALPRLSLSVRETSAPRLRRESTDEGRSTLEAIADAVSLLSGESFAAPLRTLYESFAARVLSARGRPLHKTPPTR